MVSWTASLSSQQTGVSDAVTLLLSIEPPPEPCHCPPSLTPLPTTDSPPLSSPSLSPPHQTTATSPLPLLSRAMSGSTALGVSASDAVTDALLEDGERPEGRTEWEEALIRHRIIDAPPAPPASADEELLDLPDASTGRAEALSQLSAEQLEEREDEGEDEERRMLQHYRSTRSTSPHLTSPHLTSPHLTSPHLTSPHLTSPHLTAPRSTSMATPTPIDALTTLRSPRSPSTLHLHYPSTLSCAHSPLLSASPVCGCA